MGVLTLAVAAALVAESNRQRETYIGELKRVNTDLTETGNNLQRANTELADAAYRNRFFATHAAWEQGDVGRVVAEIT